jgi:hypothetical protein
MLRAATATVLAGRERVMQLIGLQKFMPPQLPTWLNERKKV